MQGISVIICCYNSEDRLGPTLEHLARQNFRGSWEVILVDNNSTDDTVDNARKLLTSLGVPDHKIVFEPNPGLSNARACGVQHAKFDLILFCDDDNWLDKNYLSIARAFMETNPNVGVLGGMNEGVLEIDAPDWWEEKAGGYAVGKQHDYSGDITYRKVVWGAGMVLRKEILLTNGKTSFRPMLADRKGNVLSSGGDSEICRWALLMGHKLWYLEDLKLKHFIPKERLADDYVKKLFSGHGESLRILRWYDFVIDCDQSTEQNRNAFLFAVGLLQALLTVFFDDEMRRASAQLKVGPVFKIHAEVYRIIKARAVVIKELKNALR